jgi:TIR domain
VVGQNQHVAKYDTFREFLAVQPVEIREVSLSFAEVERIAGELPSSARRHRAWWGNDSKTQAMAWQAAGWRVHAVELADERVTFHRGLRVAAAKEEPAQLGTVATAARHIFISYSHLDATYINGLRKYLASSGLDVWTDDGIDYGSQWSAVIEQQIVTCAIFVPVMTPRAREAPWVNREVDLAQEIGLPILPLLLEGRPFLALRDLQHEDVTDGRMPSDRFVGRLHDLTGTLRRATARTRRVQQFLDAISDEAYRLALGRVFDACVANGLRFEWGPSGASIRMTTPDRTEPLSIAWIFGDSGWMGLRHLSLGVDTQSLIATPSVKDLVADYADAALTVPGAHRAPAVSLCVAIFEPDGVVEAEAQLIALINRLVDDVKRRPKPS